MEQRVRELLADYGRLDVDPLTIDVDIDLYLCGLTSHACVNVMLALEDEFDIEFPERLLRKSTFESIFAIQDAVSGLIGTLAR
jgi:acyl carrier protein